VGDDASEAGNWLAIERACEALDAETLRRLRAARWLDDTRWDYECEGFRRLRVHGYRCCVRESEAVERRLREIDVVLIGDAHDTLLGQEMLLSQVMREDAERQRRAVILLEVFPIDWQRSVDSVLSGDLAIPELLAERRRSPLPLSWPLDGIGRLLAWARKSGTRIVACGMSRDQESTARVQASRGKPAVPPMVLMRKYADIVEENFLRALSAEGPGRDSLCYVLIGVEHLLSRDARLSRATAHGWTQAVLLPLVAAWECDLSISGASSIRGAWVEPLPGFFWRPISRVEEIPTLLHRSVPLKAGVGDWGIEELNGFLDQLRGREILWTDMAEEYRQRSVSASGLMHLAQNVVSGQGYPSESASLKLIVGARARALDRCACLVSLLERTRGSRQALVLKHTVEVYPWTPDLEGGLVRIVQVESDPHNRLLAATALAEDLRRPEAVIPCLVDWVVTSIEKGKVFRVAETMDLLRRYGAACAPWVGGLQDVLANGGGRWKTALQAVLDECLHDTPARDGDSWRR
jgi:hypothetical protein